MSSDGHSFKVSDMNKDEVELITRRPFIKNRKTQLVLNVVLIIIILILVILIFKKEDEIELNRKLVSYPSSAITPTTYAVITAKEQYFNITDPPISKVDIKVETATVIPKINEERNTTIHVPPISNDFTMDSIEFVERDDWFSYNPICNKTLDLVHPVESIIIAHTATDECVSVAACMVRVRNIQKMHQTEKFCDIKYNFLVGGDGLVYKGLGWDIQGGSPNDESAMSLRIALIGNFEYKKPSNDQIGLIQSLIKLGIRLKKLHNNYTVCPEKHFANTNSPGKEVIKIIKKWPHYCNP